MVGHWSGLPAVSLALLVVISLSVAFAVPTGAGDNEQPTAYINDIDPFPAQANASLDFVGMGVDTDGSIIRYEWDFDGDGEYDWNSTENGEATHSYTVPDTYEPRFRVLDDGGNWSEAVTSSVVVKPAKVETGPGDDQDEEGDGALLSQEQTRYLIFLVLFVVIVGLGRTVLVQRRARVIIPPGADTTPDHFQCAVCGVDTIPGERTCNICGAIHPRVWSPA